MSLKHKLHCIHLGAKTFQSSHWNMVHDIATTVQVRTMKKITVRHTKTCPCLMSWVKHSMVVRWVACVGFCRTTYPSNRLPRDDRLWKKIHGHNSLSAFENWITRGVNNRESVVRTNSWRCSCCERKRRARRLYRCFCIHFRWTKRRRRAKDTSRRRVHTRWRSFANRFENFLFTFIQRLKAHS